MNVILSHKLIQPIVNIIGSYNLLTIQYLQISQNIQLLIKTHMLKYTITTTLHYYKNPKIRYNTRWNDWDITEN